MKQIFHPTPQRLAIAIAVALALTPIAANAIRYVPVDLGVLPGYSSSKALGINNKGQIVGSLSMPNRSFLFDPDLGMIDLGIPGESEASSINNNGDITGWTSDGTGQSWWSFVRKLDGSLTDIGNLGVPQVYAAKINDLGQVVGSALININDGMQQQYSAFLYEPGIGMRDLGRLDLGVPDGMPNDLNDGAAAKSINNLGQVVGFSGERASDFPYTTETQSFLYSGSMFGIGPIGFYTEANDISDSGIVVGNHRPLGSEIDSSAYVYSASSGYAAIGPTGPGVQAKANGVNSSGVVVGIVANPQLWPFKFSQAEGFQDVRPLLISDPGWYSIGLAKINDAGQIVGSARLPNGTQHAILLLPTPENSKDVGKSACDMVQGNPINIGTGNKFQREVDYPAFGQSPLQIARVYNSQVPSTSFLGLSWSIEYLNYRIFTESSTAVNIRRPDGKLLRFTGLATEGQWATDADSTERLFKTAQGWIYHSAEAEMEVYDTSGVLLRIVRPNGVGVTLTRSSGYLTATDSFGRALTIASGPGPFATVTTPGNQITTYQLDFRNRLGTVTYPGNFTRKYLYEDNLNTLALTGIRDEKDIRYRSWLYDSQGRAYMSEATPGISQVMLSFQPDGTHITDALGTVRVQSVTTVQGVTKSTGVSQPGGSGCTASASSKSYDANGNVVTRDDFAGTRTCFGYDLSRNLETVRVEGLSTTTQCQDVLGSGAVLPTGARKITSAWLQDWRFATAVAEPSRLTTDVYNGQQDPFDSNRTASCAPVTALLPDGKPIAVVCRHVEQATTDRTGAQGLNAAVDTGIANRETKWTYNRYGQVTSETDPRGKLTSFEYWADTDFPADDNNPSGEARGHTLGDLKTVTRPGNQISRHTHYNKRGQVLRTELPNGGVEEREYHLRGWLTKVKQWASVAAADSGAPSQDTQYDYYPTGLLKQVTQADGSWQLYLYDDAHRLTEVSDSLGNKVKYTLDNAGNAKQEDHTDQTGVLIKTISRTFDTLGRLQSQKLGAP